MRDAPSQFAARLARDERGNVLPIAAAGMLVALVVVGSAVDLSRNYLAKQQLQAACDAAVLAGRRTVTNGGWDAASKTAAESYFNTNFTDRTQGTRLTDFDVDSPDDGQTVTGEATTVLDTAVMRVFGKDTFTLTAKCASSMGVGNSDIMMVLDTTGSMDFTLAGSSQKRIDALRTAMKNFYTTIDNATAASNARIRYGFVPFSSTVNVGRLLTAIDSRYIVDSRTYQSRMWKTEYGSPSSWSGWSKVNTPYGSEGDCIRARPADSADFVDYNSSTQIKYRYKCESETTSTRSGTRTTWYVYERYQTRSVSRYWSYQPVTYSTGTFKTFAPTTTPTGSSGTDQTTTWGGCIEERATVAQATFSYSTTGGISPARARDLDLDNAPVLTDDQTKWAPLWPQISYRRYSNGRYTTANTTDGELGGTYCPYQAQLLTRMSKTEFDGYASKLVATGGTYLDIGMIWGGRLMSQKGMWSSLVNEEPDNGGKVARHLIFMTDGEMEPNAYVPQAWGMEYWDRRVTTDGTSGDTARHTSRFRATCEAIKDKGIRVWVVAFTSSLSNDLKACASDDSSFTAGSAKDLNTAFQEIAKQVGELRIVE